MSDVCPLGKASACLLIVGAIALRLFFSPSSSWSREEYGACCMIREHWRNRILRFLASRGVLHCCFCEVGEGLVLSHSSSIQVLQVRCLGFYLVMPSGPDCTVGISV